MSFTFQRIRKLAKITGLTYILGGLLGFALTAFTNMIPPLHVWALQHVLTVSSFVTFSVSGIFVVLFVRPAEAKDFIKFAALEGYEATARQKELLDAYRLKVGKTILILMPIFAAFYVAIIYFFVDPGFMSSTVFFSGEGFFFVLFSGLNFCIFFILSFVILVITIIRLNRGIKNHPELKQIYRKAMDGFLVTHADEFHRRMGIDVVREGAEAVNKEYVNSEENEFKGLWWLFFVSLIIFLSLMTSLTGSARTEWGIETIGISSLVVSILGGVCIVLFVLSLWIPSRYMKKYRYSRSRDGKGETLKRHTGTVYTRPTLNTGLVLGSTLDVLVSLLGMLVTAIGIGQVGGRIFMPLGLALMLLALVGLVLVRRQGSKMVKRLLKEVGNEEPKYMGKGVF